jgi:transposase
MGKSKKRVYTLEFKQQAVELASQMGTSQAARQLGVNVANVQRWKQEGKGSKLEKSKINIEEENRRLKKENNDLKKVNYILKRAAAFFSQDHLK